MIKIKLKKSDVVYKIGNLLQNGSEYMFFKYCFRVHEFARTSIC